MSGLDDIVNVYDASQESFKLSTSFLFLLFVFYHLYNVDYKRLAYSEWEIAIGLSDPIENNNDIVLSAQKVDRLGFLGKFCCIRNDLELSFKRLSAAIGKLPFIVIYDCRDCKNDQIQYFFPETLLACCDPANFCSLSPVSQENQRVLVTVTKNSPLRIFHLSKTKSLQFKNTMTIKLTGNRLFPWKARISIGDVTFGSMDINFVILLNALFDTNESLFFFRKHGSDLPAILFNLEVKKHKGQEPKIDHIFTKWIIFICQSSPLSGSLLKVAISSGTNSIVEKERTRIISTVFNEGSSHYLTKGALISINSFMGRENLFPLVGFSTTISEEKAFFQFSHSFFTNSPPFWVANLPNELDRLWFKFNPRTDWHNILKIIHRMEFFSNFTMIKMTECVDTDIGTGTDIVSGINATIHSIPIMKQLKFQVLIWTLPIDDPSTAITEFFLDFSREFFYNSDQDRNQRLSKSIYEIKINLKRKDTIQMSIFMTFNESDSKYNPTKVYTDDDFEQLANPFCSFSMFKNYLSFELRPATFIKKKENGFENLWTIHNFVNLSIVKEKSIVSSFESLLISPTSLNVKLEDSSLSLRDGNGDDNRDRINAIDYSKKNKSVKFKSTKTNKITQDSDLVEKEKFKLLISKAIFRSIINDFILISDCSHGSRFPSRPHQKLSKIKTDNDSDDYKNDEYNGFWIITLKLLFSRDVDKNAVFVDELIDFLDLNFIQKLGLIFRGDEKEEKVFLIVKNFEKTRGPPEIKFKGNKSFIAESKWFRLNTESQTLEELEKNVIVCATGSKDLIRIQTLNEDDIIE